MKRVVQEDATGCGIACIAMLANINYQSAKDTAIETLNFKYEGAFYTTASDLKKLGSIYNLKIGGRRRRFKEINLLPSLCILAINYSENEDTWHWVVYSRSNTEEFVLDPKKAIKSDKRMDLRRIGLKTSWFIEVKRT